MSMIILKTKMLQFKPNLIKCIPFKGILFNILNKVILFLTAYKYLGRKNILSISLSHSLSVPLFPLSSLLSYHVTLDSNFYSL